MIHRLRQAGKCVFYTWEKGKSATDDFNDKKFEQMLTIAGVCFLCQMLNS